MSRIDNPTLDKVNMLRVDDRVRQLRLNHVHNIVAHSPVMCEIEISSCRKINLIVAYCFIFVLREEHLENAFA